MARAIRLMIRFTIFVAVAGAFLTLTPAPGRMESSPYLSALGVTAVHAAPLKCVHRACSNGGVCKKAHTFTQCGLDSVGNCLTRSCPT
ncbi:MAG TPA: hypothetical protein VNL37_02320 [Candidatus Polarisedimenticolia bacterium]|nr:hypothetical protein [Candidatus Polarisedimenticolia bacterium]